MTTDAETDENCDFYVFNLPHRLYERVSDRPGAAHKMVDDLYEWIQDQVQDEWLFEVHINTGSRGLSRLYYATLTFADKAEATIFKMVWL